MAGRAISTAGYGLATAVRLSLRRFWQRQHDCIGDVRGVGAMQAMEFVDANGTACAPAAKKLVQHCRHHGVLVLTAGTYDNIIRLLMPLTLTDDESNQLRQRV